MESKKKSEKPPSNEKPKQGRFGDEHGFQGLDNALQRYFQAAGEKKEAKK